MIATIGYALLILLACASVAHAQLGAVFGQTYTGDGTYYQYTGAGGEGGGGGACSYQLTGAAKLDWNTGIDTFVAVNKNQFFGPGSTTTCGMCLAYRGVGTGAGGNPIPLAWQYGQACDQCPECLTGSLDQQKTGDGRWQLEWFPVQCNVGSGVFQWSSQGSNAYYLKIQVTNTRVPHSKVEMFVNGAWATLTSTPDNYWEYYGSYSTNFQMRVTSMLGDMVEDSFTMTPSTGLTGTLTKGKAQFPLNAAWPVVGGPLLPAIVAGASTVKPTPTPAPTPAPLPTENAGSPLPVPQYVLGSTTDPNAKDSHWYGMKVYNLNHPTAPLVHIALRKVLRKDISSGTAYVTFGDCKDIHGVVRAVQHNVFRKSTGAKTYIGSYLYPIGTFPY